MAAYLVCLTTEGGIPLFTRTKGNLPQVSGFELNNLFVIILSVNTSGKVLNCCPGNGQIKFHKVSVTCKTLNSVGTLFSFISYQ